MRIHPTQTSNSPLASVLARIGMSLIGAAGMFLLAGNVQAIQLADGTVSFEKSPRLIGAITTFNASRVWGAKYYFTLNVPESAGEPLQKVTISQRQGTETIRFRVQETFAFEGTPSSRGKELATETVAQNNQSAPLTVTLIPPVPPGSTVTIGLKPRRNPRWGGVYLFGVTAFPAGAKARGLYLGVGRLHFYERGYRRFW